MISLEEGGNPPYLMRVRAINEHSMTHCKRNHKILGIAEVTTAVVEKIIST